ncbi:MAG TPA: M1 family aminopeptidase, partial [Polyangiaceae bacterium]|nr:M1 family aminopeptidase [Polyangiaceae bacterium]
MGQLESRELAGAEPKLTLWKRRGTPVDSEVYLARLRNTLNVLVDMLGPYPFDTYAVALLPAFPEGMENSSVSFMTETAAQTHAFDMIGAHELAHQWFGDSVTIRSWSDLWVKEGLATLLAYATQRETPAGAVSPRLAGEFFAFDPEYPIRDPSAADDPDIDSLYTTGPYTRAAWLLTQIRAELGDDTFFARLRSVLADYEDRSVDGAQLLDVLTAGLAPALRERASRLLDAKGSPELRMEESGERSLTFTLSDPDELILRPFEVTVVDANGATTQVSLATSAPTTLSVPAGGYVALDERDVHPSWSIDAIPFLLPTTEGARSAFLSRSAAAQENALVHTNTPPFASSADFVRDYPQFDSSDARTYALMHACYILQASAPAAQISWRAALMPVLRAREEAGFTPGLAACGVELARAAFADELTALLGSAALTPKALARLAWIASFDFGAAQSFSSFAPLAASSPSTALRDVLVTRLALQAAGVELSAPNASEMPAYVEFLRDALSAATSAERILAVLPAIVALEDATLLDLLADAVIRVQLPALVQREVVCAAYAAAPSAEAWAHFQGTLREFPDLSAAARALLNEPSSC